MALGSGDKNGDRFGRWEKGFWTVNGSLVKNATGAVLDAPWHPVRGSTPVTVIFSGDFTGVARLLVSADQQPPDDDNNAYPQYSTDITGNRHLVIDNAINYMKVVVDSVSAGELTARYIIKQVQQ